MTDRTSQTTTGPRCDLCGRFHSAVPGSSWAMIYSGYPPTPDHEVSRCIFCTKVHGPLTAQIGIVPKYGAGIVMEKVA